MEENKIIAYKGFDYKLSCDEIQYEVGKEYELESEDIVCGLYGFHAYKNPIDVFRHYKHNMSNRFCVVELSGKIVEEGFLCTAQKIKIIKEIEAEDIYAAWVELMISENNTKKILCRKKTNANNKDEDFSLIEMSTHEKHILSNSEHVSIISSGWKNMIRLTGYCATVLSSGRYANIKTIGSNDLIISKGFAPHIVTSGRETLICATDDYGQISLNGSSCRICALGSNMDINAHGMNIQIWSCGRDAQISTNGCKNMICSSGANAQITTCGFEDHVESKGKNAIICCTGQDSVVKAKIGSYITLTEWGEEYPEYYVPILSRTEFVDGDRIKEDTWYYIENGEFAEAKYTEV